MLVEKDCENIFHFWDYPHLPRYVVGRLRGVDKEITKRDSGMVMKYWTQWIFREWHGKKGGSSGPSWKWTSFNHDSDPLGFLYSVSSSKLMTEKSKQERAGVASVCQLEIALEIKAMFSASYSRDEEALSFSRHYSIICWERMWRTNCLVTNLHILILLEL